MAYNSSLDYDQLAILDFGYLTGIDLAKYCPFQVLQKQYIVDNLSLEIGVNTAYSELSSKLSARYNIALELTKRTTTRYALVVKIVALLAIRDIVGNQSGLPENMITNFKWVDDTILEIRNGQTSLGIQVALTAQNSTTEIISNSFNTLG
jgi:hypothetical protein